MARQGQAAADGRASSARVVCPYAAGTFPERRDAALSADRAAALRDVLRALPDEIPAGRRDDRPSQGAAPEKAADAAACPELGRSAALLQALAALTACAQAGRPLAEELKAPRAAESLLASAALPERLARPILARRASEQANLVALLVAVGQASPEGSLESPDAQRPALPAVDAAELVPEQLEQRQAWARQVQLPELAVLRVRPDACARPLRQLPLRPLQQRLQLLQRLPRLRLP